MSGEGTDSKVLTVHDLVIIDDVIDFFLIMCVLLPLLCMYPIHEMDLFFSTTIFSSSGVQT